MENKQLKVRRRPYLIFETPGEHNPFPSMTVPGEALTMKQIVDRYKKSMPVPERLHQFLDVPVEEIDDRFHPHADLTDAHANIEHMGALIEKIKKDAQPPEPPQPPQPPKE